jgi:hypothetical protein
VLYSLASPIKGLTFRPEPLKRDLNKIIYLSTTFSLTCYIIWEFLYPAYKELRQGPGDLYHKSVES